MAVGMFRGVDNVKREIKRRFRSVDNVTHEIKKRWRSVDNVARLTFQSGLTVYNRGKFYGGAYTANATVKSDHLVFYTNYDDQIVLPSIDFSKYSTLHMVVSVDSYASSGYDPCRYLDMWIKRVGGTGNQYSDFCDDYCDLVDEEFERVFDITGCTLNGVYSLAIQFKNKADDTLEKQNLYVHKIWLE